MNFPLKPFRIHGPQSAFRSTKNSEVVTRFETHRDNSFGIFLPRRCTLKSASAGSPLRFIQIDYPRGARRRGVALYSTFRGLVRSTLNPTRRLFVKRKRGRESREQRADSKGLRESREAILKK